jgi:hypothetical protein
VSIPANILSVKLDNLAKSLIELSEVRSSRLWRDWRDPPPVVRQAHHPELVEGAR